MLRVGDNGEFADDDDDDGGCLEPAPTLLLFQLQLYPRNRQRTAQGGAGLQ